MNKQQIIDQLNAAGVTFDPTRSKAELAALLGAPVGKPGEEAANTGTTGEAPAAGPPGPADDKPAEMQPADVNFVPPVVVDPPPPLVVEQAPQAETLPFPSPFPKVIPDEEWNTAMQADFEVMLAEKIAAGLSKEQALEVIERQIDWDLNGAR